MSELRVDKISPQSGTEMTLGDNLDDFLLPSGAEIKAKSGSTITIESGATLANAGTATGFPSGGYTSEALVSLTSGTTKDITIASGVTSIVIHFNLISITGSSTLTMQLGDAGGIETSGYISLGMNIPNGAANSAQSYTDRFIIGPRMVDSDVLVGAITLTRGDTSTHYWSVTSVFNDRASEDQKLHSGNKTLSAELTTIRLLGGTFDGAGSYSLSYM